MKPIRILYVNGGIMSRGGIESFMMNYYKYFDKDKIQVDFIVHGFEKGIYDDEIKSMGGKIYNVPIKSKDYFGNISALTKIFRSGNYKVVHSHMDAMSMVVLKIAKKCGIPIRIAHSHNTQHLTKNLAKYFINEYARKNITKYATHYFACSHAAGRWLFGTKFTDKKITVINNAINLNDYLFNNAKRNELREKYDLNSKYVIGHVGRFDYQKNHMFLLEIFRELLKKKPDSILFLVGDGHLRSDIESKITDLNIGNNVIIAGIRNDVSQLMNAFDIFCLPSHFEGLPVVLVEAQANGLKCITSDTVTTEVDISGDTKFIGLGNEFIDVWVNNIVELNRDPNRTIDNDLFIDAGYSISHEAQKLQDTYLSLAGVET